MRFAVVVSALIVRDGLIQEPLAGAMTVLAVAAAFLAALQDYADFRVQLRKLK